MLFNYLGEGHLSNADHASPSSVSNVGALKVVIKLGKACSVCQPWGLTESFKQKFILLLRILFIDLDCSSQEVNTVTWLHEARFVKGFDHANDAVADVKACIPYFFERCEVSCLGYHERIIYLSKTQFIIM